MEVTGAQPHEQQQETPSQSAVVMYISLNQAAKLWGKSKGTISKLASSGKLQWHAQPNGERKLFLPELSTRFGPPPSEQLQPVAKQAVVTSKQPQERPGNAIEFSRLEAELNGARQMIEQLRTQMRREAELLESQLERERQNADHWRVVASNAQELLKALPAPTRVDQQPARKVSWFDRIRGKATA